MKNTETEFHTVEDYKNNCYCLFKYLLKRMHELTHSEGKVNTTAGRQIPRIFNHYDLQI